jgi:hypothetical protein
MVLHDIVQWAGMTGGGDTFNGLNSTLRPGGNPQIGPHDAGDLLSISTSNGTIVTENIIARGRKEF